MNPPQWARPRGNPASLLKMRGSKLKSRHHEISSLHPRMSGYFANTSLIAFVGRGFAGGGHILGASALQDFLCSLGPRGIVGMN
jgi:hypothetical protein